MKTLPPYRFLYRLYPAQIHDFLQIEPGLTRPIHQ